MGRHRVHHNGALIHGKRPIDQNRFEEGQPCAGLIAADEESATLERPGGILTFTVDVVLVDIEVPIAPLAGKDAVSKGNGRRATRLVCR